MTNSSKRITMGPSKGLALLAGSLMLATPAMGDIIYQESFENFNNAGGLWSSTTKSSLGGPYTTILGQYSAATVRLNLLATEQNAGGVDTDPGANPYNIKVKQFNANKNAIPYPDSSGGGGNGGGPIGQTDLNIPKFNLGNAIKEATINPGDSGPPQFATGRYAIHFDLMLFDSWDGAYERFGVDSFALKVNGQTLFDEILYSYSPELNFRMPDEYPSQNVFNTNWVDLIYRDIVLEFEVTEPRDHFAIDFIGRPSQSILDESWGIDNVMIERLSSSRSLSVPEVPAPGTLVILGGSFGLLGRRRR